MPTNAKSKSDKATRAARGRAYSGLQTIIDSAEDLLESVRDETGEAVEDLRARVSAAAASARERLAEMAADAGEKASDAAVSFVRADPWRAVALAALAFITISTIMRSGDE